MAERDLAFVVKFVNEASKDLAAIRGDLDKLTQSSEKTTVATKSVATSMDGMKSAAVLASTAVAGLATAFGSFKALNRFVNEFAELEENMNAVARAANLDVAATEELTRSFQNLSTEIPISSNQLAHVAEVVADLGIIGSDNIERVTETMAKFGAVTGQSGASATQQLIAVTRSTGESAESIEGLANVFVKLGNATSLSTKEVGRNAAIFARSLGPYEVTGAQAAAIGTAFGQVGVQAQKASLVTTRVFSGLSNAVAGDAKAMAAALNITGQSAQDLAATLQADPARAFEIFLKGLNDSKLAGRDITDDLAALGISSFEAARSLNPLAQNLGKLAEAQRIASEEAKNGKALNEEATKAFETLNSRLAILKNTFQVTFQKLGEAFTPVVLTVVNGLISFGKAINDILDRLTPFATKFLEITAAITIGIPLLGGLVTAFTVLGPLLVAAVVAVGNLALAFGRLAIAILLNPLFLIPATFVLVFVAFDTLLNYMLGVETTWESVTKSIVDGAKTFINTIGFVGSAIGTIFAAAFETALTLGSNMFKILTEKAGIFAKSLALLLSGEPVAAFKALGEEAKTGFTDGLGEIGTILADELETAANKDYATPLFQKIGEAFNALKKLFIGPKEEVRKLGEILDYFGTTVEQKFSPGFWDPLRAGFNTAKKGVVEGLIDLSGTIENFQTQTAAVTAKTFAALGDEIFNFAKTGKFNIEDFARSFIDAITKMVIQLVIMKPLLDGLATALSGNKEEGGSSGVISGLLGAIGSVFGGGETEAVAAAQGGDVSGLRKKISVPTVMFKNARRYAAGGGVGFGSDTIPALLSPGEKVLNPQQAREYDSGGGVNVNVTIMAADVASFRGSESQIASKIGSGIQRASRRNG